MTNLQEIEQKKKERERKRDIEALIFKSNIQLIRIPKTEQRKWKR